MNKGRKKRTIRKRERETDTSKRRSNEKEKGRRKDTQKSKRNNTMTKEQIKKSNEISCAKVCLCGKTNIYKRSDENS